MSALGSLLKRSLENPTQPLSSSSLAEWLGGGTVVAGVSVTERKVYGLPAYFRGVALLSGTMAGLPFHVYKNGTRERVTQQTVIDNPNPRQTPFEYRQTMYANAITWGNAYARKLRDRADIVRQSWPIHPSKVQPFEVDPTEQNPAGKLFKVQTDKGEKILTPRDVFHLPYLSLDGVVGMRPLELFRQVHGITLAQQQTAGRFYGQGTQISGVLQTDEKLEPDHADAVKARWKQKHSGSGNAGDIAVLDKGLKFTPLSLPPGDAQLLESREFSDLQISQMLGLPPHMLGMVDKSTSWGTGIEQQVIGLVVFNVQHWLTLIEQRSTRELLPGGWTSGSWYAKHAVQGLMRGDAKTRAAFYHSGITDGWLNRNTVRELEDMEPEEGLDEYLVPSNLTLISVDGQLVPLSADGTADAAPAD